MDYDLTGLVVDGTPIHAEGWVTTIFTDEFEAEQLIQIIFDGAALHEAERSDTFADTIEPGLDRFLTEVMAITDNELQPLDTLLISLVCFVCGLVTGKADDFGVDLENQLIVTLAKRSVMHYAVVIDFPHELVPHLPDAQLVFDLKRILN